MAIKLKMVFSRWMGRVMNLHRLTLLKMSKMTINKIRQARVKVLKCKSFHLWRSLRPIIWKQIISLAREMPSLPSVQSATLGREWLKVFVKSCRPDHQSNWVSLYMHRHHLGKMQLSSLWICSFSVNLVSLIWYRRVSLKMSNLSKIL